MEPLQILQVVVSILEKLGVPSMLVGSFASSSHGFPRLTQAADLVVQLDRVCKSGRKSWAFPTYGSGPGKKQPGSAAAVPNLAYTNDNL
jgi:hypothetical protein